MKLFAVATDKVAEAAATRILKQRGTATDALLAGFWAAAGARAEVLFSPAQMLVAGPGVGPRAFDGRARQPGRGAPRPRGFLDGQPVPEAARIAVPTSTGMLAIAHALDGHLTLHRLLEPAFEMAQERGAKGREVVLRRIAAAGVAALREPAILRPLLAVSGTATGGLLTEADMAEVRPDSAPPQVLGAKGAGRGRALVVSPWQGPSVPHRTQEIIAAADARGVLGVMSYAPDPQGVAVPELELLLCRDASVVLRGVPRVRPGAVLACPAPIAIATEATRPVFGFGVGAALELAQESLADAWQNPATTALMMLRAAAESVGAPRAFGVVCSPESGEARGLLIPTGEAVTAEAGGSE